MSLAGFEQRRAGFAPRAVHVGFVMNKVALGQVSFRVFRFQPVRIIPPLNHIYTRIIWKLQKLIQKNKIWYSLSIAGVQVS